MPMSPKERQRVIESIASLLADEIHGQFSVLYAAAVSSIEMHPEQVNNELRNALTHISRAVCADSAEQADKEMARAIAHVERAKRDVVKIAVIRLRDMINEGCAQIRAMNGTVDPAFLVRRNEIRKKRRDLLQQEAKGVLVLNDFVSLYLETDELNTDVHDVLADHGRKRSTWEYILLSLRRQFGAAVLGLIIGVLACMAYAIMEPDNEAFGNAGRRMLHLPPQAKPPAAASTLSTDAKRAAPASPRSAAGATDH